MKYRDEKDKCYGVVGMAIGLHVWDVEDMFTSITLDAQGFDCINFTPDIIYSKSQSISPKATWQHQLKMFQVFMGLATSNVMCRKIIGDGSSFTQAHKVAILDAFEEEAREEFDLDDYESERMFNNMYTRLVRLYNHSLVREMVDDFAAQLNSRRKMTACEDADALALLYR